MKATKRWIKNEIFGVGVVENGESKVHLVMKNTRRLREDGFLIEEAPSFYTYTKSDGDWKIFAISVFILQAKY